MSDDEDWSSLLADYPFDLPDLPDDSPSFTSHSRASSSADGERAAKRASPAVVVTSCWGGQLMKDSSRCTEFTRSGRDFRHMFCPICSRCGIAVPVGRTRALTVGHADSPENSRGRGVWSVGHPRFRVINNTTRASPPALVIIEDESELAAGRSAAAASRSCEDGVALPSEAEQARADALSALDAVPPDWISSDGMVEMRLSKGTLVPSATLNHLVDPLALTVSDAFKRVCDRIEAEITSIAATSLSAAEELARYGGSATERSEVLRRLKEALDPAASDAMSESGNRLQKDARLTELQGLLDRIEAELGNGSDDGGESQLFSSAIPPSPTPSPPEPLPSGGSPLGFVSLQEPHKHFFIFTASIVAAVSINLCCALPLDSGSTSENSHLLNHRARAALSAACSDPMLQLILAAACSLAIGIATLPPDKYDALFCIVSVVGLFLRLIHTLLFPRESVLHHDEYVHPVMYASFSSCFGLTLGTLRRADLAILAYGCGEAISFATFITALVRFGCRLALFPLCCFDLAVLPWFTAAFLTARRYRGGAKASEFPVSSELTGCSDVV